MSNPTELPDLDRLESLARAATPGPWPMTEQAREMDFDKSYTISLGENDEICDQRYYPSAPRRIEDARFIAAANPAAVLALIALARRAQPEGEAPQAEPADERTDFEAAMIARGYQREMFDGFYAEGEHAYYDKMANCMFSAWRAALAAQSQGAQALTADDLWEIQGALRAHGKVALSRKVADAASRAQQAAAPGSLAVDPRAEQWVTVRVLACGDHENTAADAVHHALQFAYENKPGCIEAWDEPQAEAVGRIERGTSAPGTPEAPNRRAALEAARIEVAMLANGKQPVEYLAALRDACDVLRAFAAQLDGGQGEPKAAAAKPERLFRTDDFGQQWEVTPEQAAQIDEARAVQAGDQGKDETNG